MYKVKYIETNEMPLSLYQPGEIAASIFAHTLALIDVELVELKHLFEQRLYIIDA
jgi:hypothetical protein